MAWDDVLNAKNSIFALDFSDLTLAKDVEAVRIPDITSTVNEIGAVLKLDVESSDRLDVVVRGAETFVRFDDNGLLVTPDFIALEFDWSNTHSATPVPPALSTPRKTSVEEGVAEHLQYSELGYMNTADMVSGPDRIIGIAQADSL